MDLVSDSSNIAHWEKPVDNKALGSAISANNETEYAHAISVGRLIISCVFEAISKSHRYRYYPNLKRIHDLRTHFHVERCWVRIADKQ